VLSFLVLVILLQYNVLNGGQNSFLITNFNEFEVSSALFLEYIGGFLAFIFIYTLAPLSTILILILILFFTVLSNFFYKTYLTNIIELNLFKVFNGTLCFSNSSNIFSNEFYTNLIYIINSSFKNLQTLNIKDIYADILYFLDNYLNYPIFLYCGLLFFLTTIISLLSLNYLGLYGTFILNLISLTVL